MCGLSGGNKIMRKLELDKEYDCCTKLLWIHYATAKTKNANFWSMQD